ncbi:uncharacterized protein LOC103317854 [Nasonia vitripennis]|uniref:Death domain-containing protein n=1 Tax=Nasonia vitripennis TaxID=7425 RepID=A0A7M7IQF8_NASVI|nr:uncharacterized protein LOC103317854 [Nasonia vitripennis]
MQYTRGKMIHSPLTLLLVALTSICERGRNMVRATIDVNLAELEYLSARLDPHECRRLVAALHYDSYELPESLAGAEHEVSDDIPCLRHLLHWNGTPGEGRGKTHELIERRLRQLGHQKLADWLGRTTFRELGKDLTKLIDEPLPGAEEQQQTSTSLAVLHDEVTDGDATATTAVIDDDSDNESFWSSIELIVQALFAGLTFALVVILGALVIDRFARCSGDSGNN